MSLTGHAQVPALVRTIVSTDERGEGQKNRSLKTLRGKINGQYEISQENSSYAIYKKK